MNSFHSFFSEYGAVKIYDGVIFSILNFGPFLSSVHKTSNVNELLAFAQEHRQTELRHLKAMEAIVPHQERTALIPIWWASGFILGFLPAIVKGSRGVYETVSYVEEFVFDHYQNQIDLVNKRLTDLQEIKGEEYSILLELRNVLLEFQNEEKHHMKDALSRIDIAGPSFASRIWKTIVQKGSEAAVFLSKLL